MTHTASPLFPLFTLLLCTDDLIFPSRIREALRPLGGALIVAATEAAISPAIQNTPAPDLILINLSARRFDPFALISMLKSQDAARDIPVIAFAGHVEKDKHERARQVGADLVAANSSISLHLPELLRRVLPGKVTDEKATD